MMSQLVDQNRLHRGRAQTPCQEFRYDRGGQGDTAPARGVGVEFRAALHVEIDVARFDADGFLILMDRRKDVIISGGENISSVEVEDVLYRHPAVAFAGVVARPDPKWGETPVAYVELKPGASVTEQELIEHCRSQLAGFKVPRTVIFDVVPRTSTGKIQKNVLRERSRSSEAFG